MKSVIITICLVLLVPAVWACGANLLVPSQYPTIQAAVNATINGDIVIVASGTYTGDGNRDIDFLGKAITIRSTDPNDSSIVTETVIDCNGSVDELHRGFYFHSGEEPNSVLEGFTIIRGAQLSGGGIKFENSSPFIRNCRVLNNYACGDSDGDEWGGGGFACWGGNPLIRGCTISGNTSRYAGDEVIIQDGNAQVDNCNIIGGVLAIWGGNPKISRCLFLCSYTAIDIISYSTTECIIENNIIRSRYIGIYLSENMVGGMLGQIRNNVIVGTGIREGIGIQYRAHNSNPWILNNIIVNCNKGIEFVYDTSEEDRKEKIRYNNLWDNTINYISQGMVYDLTGLQGNISADPLFANYDTNDFRISYSSPCLDAGINSGVYIDLDGNLRPVDGDSDTIAAWDIGAYELAKLDVPNIIVSPAEVSFYIRPGGENIESQNILIKNGGGRTLHWNIVSECPWLSFSSTSGKSKGNANEVTLFADASGLSIVKHDCNVLVYGDGAANSPVVVRVSLIVNGDLHVPSDYNTIQAAIDASYNGDRVIVADGIYIGYGNRDIDFKGKAITVCSANGHNNCIIDCGAYDRGFSFVSAEKRDSILEGFTIRNGYSTDGGAIYCAGGGPTIRGCVLMNNQASEYGGAIFSLSTALVEDCVIANNSAWANSGGGIYGTSLEIRNSLIYGNEAANVGGGILAIGASGTNLIINCTIVGNYADNYSGNSGYGGGVQVNEGQTILQNCIVRDNSAPNGDQISMWAWSSPSSAQLNVLCSNIEGGSSGIWQNTECDIEWMPGNIDTDPCFANPDEYDYHLPSQSPCINTGDPNYVPGAGETDLDGNTRVIRSRIDMGAYEFNHQPVAAAGPNQVAYAWIDGTAQVTLDANNSYDPDGNSLTHLWRWSVDGNDYEANEVNSVIELPVGQHTIELVVNNGREDSEPNYVIITVIEPIKCTLMVRPHIISRQKRVMTTLRLPIGITKDQIDSNSTLLLYPGELESVSQSINGGRSVRILACFDSNEFLDAIDGNGPVQVYVVGQLKTGQYFYCSDSIRIIN